MLNVYCASMSDLIIIYNIFFLHTILWLCVRFLYLFIYIYTHYYIDKFMSLHAST